MASSHALVTVARNFDPAFDAASVELRPSSGNKYLGVTLTVTATSREQLDELYRTLVDPPDGQGGALMPEAAVAAPLPATLHTPLRTTLQTTLQTLGRVDYVPTLDAMRSFTEARTADTPDEIWLCEHPPVYTQGLAGKAEHVLDPHGIPVVQTNRGGQVTYHGPGQVVAYPLIDLQRLGIYVKEYVFRLEQAVIKTLESVGVTGHRVRGAPGIYVRLADPFGHAALAPAPEGAGPVSWPGQDRRVRHQGQRGTARTTAWR